MFHVLTITYDKPLDVIDQTRPDHLAFLADEVAAGRLLLAGRQESGAGGVLITGISGGEYGTRGFLDGWDLKTGAKKWSDRGVGKGSLCYADGMLYLFGENLAVVENFNDRSVEVQLTFRGDSRPGLALAIPDGPASPSSPQDQRILVPARGLLVLRFGR